MYQINHYDLLGRALAGDFQTFVDSVMAVRYNQPQWKRFFRWGVPSLSTTFEAMEAETGLTAMASVIDPSAPKPRRGTDGVTLYTGGIPKLGHGYDLNEKQIREQLIIVDKGGEFALDSIRNILFNNIEKIEFGVHSRINNMAFQAMSNGSIVVNATNNPDGGVIIDIDMRVPTLNKKWAGWDNGVSAAWTDSSALPLTDLQDTFDYADDNFKPYDVMYMAKSLFRTFSRHPNVINQVNAWKDRETLTGVVSTKELKAYLNDMGFPPIVIIDEASAVESDGAKSTIKSYDESNVVITTIGIIGTVKNAESILGLTDDPSVRKASTEEGRIQLVQAFDSKRLIQSVDTEALGFPILDNPGGLIIIDTSKTSTWT